MAIRTATVTSLDPLEVRLAGTETSLPVARSLVLESELSVDDAVMVENVHRRLTILGRVGGTEGNRDFLLDPITTDEIGDGSVLAAKLADAAVTRAKIVDDAIDQSKIAQGNVVRALMEVDEIDGTHIGDNAIATDHIAAGSIVTAHMTAGTIHGDRIAAFSIEATQIASYNLTSQNASFENAIIQTAAIADLAVVGAKIANATITNAKIANLNASKITTGSLAVGTVISSSNFDSGAGTGWAIDYLGNAVFNQVTVRGTIDASTLKGVLALHNSGGTNPGVHVGNFYALSDHVWIASFGSDRINLSGDVRTNNLIPFTDNSWPLGFSSLRWTGVWAVDGTINTSDVREKRDITPITESDALDRVVRVADEATINFYWNEGERKHAGFDADKVGEIHGESSAAYIDPTVESGKRVNPWKGQPTREWLDEQQASRAKPNSTAEELQAIRQEARERWARRRAEFEEETLAMSNSPKGIRPHEMIPDLYVAVSTLTKRVAALEGSNNGT